MLVSGAQKYLLINAPASLTLSCCLQVGNVMIYIALNVQ